MMVLISNILARTVPIPLCCQTSHVLMVVLSLLNRDILEELQLLLMMAHSIDLGDVIKQFAMEKARREKF